MSALHREALVLGAGGFIGSHLVRRLVADGYRVRGVDLRHPEFSPTAAQEFIIADLRDADAVARVLDGPYDEVYQLAADMGGAGYVFTGDHDAAIMRNSALINLHVAGRCRTAGVGRLLFTSSACVYPAQNQADSEHPVVTEDSAYPAEPDSEYGWEKLFGERLYQATARNEGLDVRIVRLHNVFGPEGAWRGGREKAPAALCRKVAEAEQGGEMEIWGDGGQTRSFLYIDECIEGLRRVMSSDLALPVNLGSEEMISIDALARMIIRVAGKDLRLRHVAGPVGVRGRTSDNRLLRASVAWAPAGRLEEGVRATYAWVAERVRLARGAP